MSGFRSLSDNEERLATTSSKTSRL
jgi:hypothetical protein